MTEANNAKKPVAIVIVTYNIDVRVFLLQIMAIKKFCKDDFEIIVVDNSTDKGSIESISYHCDIDRGIIYHKTVPSSFDGSESHAFAVNYIHNKIRGEYNYCFFLDHDCIPVKDFSVTEILADRLCAGVGQQKSRRYFWAGCFMYDTVNVSTKFTFSPNRILGLDTAGDTYRIIEEYGVDKCVFFDEQHVQNPEFNKSMYDFYSLIFNGTFIHFINASNWNRSESNEERLSSLINITQKKMEESNGNV